VIIVAGFEHYLFKDSVELLCITYSTIGALLVHVLERESAKVFFFFFIGQQWHALLLTNGTKSWKRHYSIEVKTF
jgi:hypothetical protein